MERVDRRHFKLNPRDIELVAAWSATSAGDHELSRRLLEAADLTKKRVAGQVVLKRFQRGEIVEDGLVISRRLTAHIMGMAETHALDPAPIAGHSLSPDAVMRDQAVRGMIGVFEGRLPVDYENYSAS